MSIIYKLKWGAKVKEDFFCLDPTIALKINERIKTHLVQAPKQLGKTLTAQYKGLYRYRYGDYRILYEIDENDKSIIINRIGHRKEIY